MMQIEVISKDTKPGLEILPFFKDGMEAPKAYKSLDAGEWIFTEKEGQKQLLFCLDASLNEHSSCNAFRLLAVKTGKFWGDNAVMDFSAIAKIAKAATRGLFMSGYQINPDSEKNDLADKCKVFIKGDKDMADQVATARMEAEVQMWAMKLVDLPPNKKTPEMIGLAARNSAKENGFECEVWNDDHIVNGGLHALHAVGKGSANPPVFIISRYRGNPNTKSVDLALVGKGITFDTGGISIKGSGNLHYMKSDMAGAAAMLGAIALAAKLKLPLNITTVVPSAENSVDANSVLPGEVIASYSGKTIEIIDTDAEGRLVLADGLSWTKRNENPAIMIDMATLTGSSVRALGFEAAALYCDNEKLTKALDNAGMATGEKLWRMPLWKDYDSYIHSDVADVSNLPLRPVAGSIAAAKFLQVFSDGHSAWAHMDMPGMSFGDSPFYKTKSATGFGVQLLGDFMRQLADNPDIASNK